MAARAPQFPPFPQAFREQLIYVLDDCFGEYYEDELGIGQEAPVGNELWAGLYRTFVRRRGLREVARPFGISEKRKQFSAFIRTANDAWLEAFLIDFVDFIAAAYDNWARENYLNVSAAVVFERLETHLREHRLPYTVVDGSLVRTDRALAARQIEGPAMAMLRGDREFAAAATELDDALRFLEVGRPERAIHNAALAVESTIKVIGARLGWKKMPPKPTLGQLLDLVREEKLIGPTEVAGLRQLVEATEKIVAGTRNVAPGAGHGAGSGSDGVTLAAATFVVDVACAAVKHLHTSLRAREQSAPT